MNENIISVSRGNMKMGAVPSISFPAVTTCRPGAPCVTKCYAVRMEKRRASIRNAYARNLEIYKRDPASFELQATAAAITARYFRFFVSGDIPDPAFIDLVARVCRACDGTRFLLFTKRYEWVNAWIDENGPLPDNLSLIFSAWRGLDVPNPHRLPVSHVLYKDGYTTAPDDAFICGGNCFNCICAGVGCWQLKTGENVVFAEH